MSEKIWCLKRCSLFEQLTAEELRLVESRSYSRKFARATPIYLPADPGDFVYVLATGRAKICHLTPEGKQSILTFIEPGEMFGELALLDQGSREEYAETSEPSLVVKIPVAVIEQLMHRHPEISLGITKIIGWRRRRIERRLKNLLFLPNRQRLTHLLLELAEQYGYEVPQGIRLGIKLSHQELANVIGSTRETVTLVLGELQNEGILEVGRKKIMILQPQKLADIVHEPVPHVGPQPAAAGGQL